MKSMKPFPLILAAALAGAIPSGMAQTYIWDTSTDAGYQNANGTWGSDNFWTTNSGANSGTVLSGWTSGATAWFGGNATVAATPGGNVTTTVDGTQTAASVRQIQNGAGDFTLTGGTLVLGAGGVRADRGTFTVDSVITNSAATLQLNVQSATGIVVLGGNNTYTATSEIRGVSGGTVRLNNSGALGTGSSVQFVNGSVLLDLNGFDVSGKTITVNASQTGFLGNTAATKSIWSGNVNLANATGSLRAGGTNAEVEISGTISGVGTLQSFDSGTLRLSGDNTYSGGTSVRAGSTLIVGHSNALGSVSHTNFIQAATLDLNGFDIGSRIITLQDNASRLVNNNTNSAAAVSGPVNMLTNRSNAQIGGDGNLTLSGNMATQDGTGGGFTKVGSGTLTLSGSNTYTGTTTVSAGSLIVDGSQSTGVLDVSSGATLGGSGTIGGTTTISGVLAPGNSIGTLTVANDVTWNGGENWVFELGAAGPSIGSPGTSDLLAITGGNDFIKGTGASFTFDFAGTGDFGWYKLVDWAGGSTTFDVLDFAGVNLGGVYTSEFAIQDNALYVNVVPEPSTYALLVLAAAGLGAHVVRRRRSA